jgi:drug/metabolite transporter, DME family
VLAVSAAGILWGTTGVVVARLHSDAGLGPLSIGFWRLLIAAVVLAVALLPRRRRLAALLRRHPWGSVLAGVGLACYQALYFLAVTWVGVSVATLVSLGAAPVITAVWEAAHDRVPPGPRQLLVLVVALVGLGFIAAGTTGAAGPHPVLGLLAALGSGATYAATSLLSASISRGNAGVGGPLTAVMSTVGALVMLPFGLVEGIVGHLPPSSGGGVVWAEVGGLVYLGVVPTALAYGLFNAGLRHVRPSVAAVLTLWEPITAAALAVLLLREPITPAAATGSGLLLLAVLLLSISPRGRPEPADPVPVPQQDPQPRGG